MKKVLLLGQIWPYHPRAGNVIHPIAKYLSEYGWEPIVLTTPLPEKVKLPYKVTEIPYTDSIMDLIKLFGFDTTKSMKKQLARQLNVKKKQSFLDPIFLLLQEILYYPGTLKGWQRPVFKKACELIEKENICAIVSELPPIIGVLASKKLKDK